MANEEYIGDVLKKGKIWDYREIYTFLIPLIPHNKDVLDIGSHIGCHAIPYSKKIVSPNVVHCFDAQRRMFDLLVENIILNHADNVIAHNVAVGHT